MTCSFFFFTVDFSGRLQPRLPYRLSCQPTARFTTFALSIMKPSFKWKNAGLLYVGEIPRMKKPPNERTRFFLLLIFFTLMLCYPRAFAELPLGKFQFSFIWSPDFTYFYVLFTFPSLGRMERVQRFEDWLSKHFTLGLTRWLLLDGQMFLV